MKRKPSILVCNDDGLFGPGLKPLAQALRPLGRVTVVVPEHERSAASHALTFHKPLRVRCMEEGIYVLNGTPADAVRFGVFSILKERVDIVVSGINRGANMGADTLYSGTVGAAREGCMLGYPSAAFSLANPRAGHYETAGIFARELVKVLLKRGLPPQVCLNVNVPDRAPGRIKGVAVTRLGQRVYGKDVHIRKDPRGETYYWMAGIVPSGVHSPGTDMTAVRHHKISVTPIRLDMTAAETIVDLQQWALTFADNGRI